MRLRFFCRSGEELLEAVLGDVDAVATASRGAGTCMSLLSCGAGGLSFSLFGAGGVITLLGSLTSNVSLSELLVGVVVPSPSSVELSLVVLVCRRRRPFLDPRRVLRRRFFWGEGLLEGVA